MGLIFGYDKFQDNGDPFPNAFEADIKNNVSPINLGWAGYEFPDPTNLTDYDLANKQKTFPLMFQTHSMRLSGWFDIQVQNVEEIKEKYYYVIDVYPHSFWETKEARYPKISGQAISDIKSRKHPVNNR